MSDDELSMDEFADGMALWEEHQPQTGEDWRAVARRFIAADGDASKSSPLFAAVVSAESSLALCEAERERLKGELAELRRGGERWAADLQRAVGARERAEAEREVQRQIANRLESYAKQVEAEREKLEEAARELATWAEEARGHYGIEETAGPGQPATEWDEIQDGLRNAAADVRSVVAGEGGEGDEHGE